MAQVKSGDRVKIHYSGAFDDGTVFDDSKARGPLEFTVGAQEVIVGMEEAIIGMSPGESKSERIAPERAYGASNPEMTVEVERKHIPSDMEPEVGHQVKITQDDGSTIVAQVIGVTKEHVTLDANHPMAGKELIFDIELLEIVGA
ncbi:MAG: peptidylprolyl isomerase [Proteobacteria bacterium]|nr:peptidylprolyl isomerase [Pseudomonadota bacterium]